MDKVTTETVSTNHSLFEEPKSRAEAVSNRGPSAYQPKTLTARPNRLSRNRLMVPVYVAETDDSTGVCCRLMTLHSAELGHGP